MVEKVLLTFNINSLDITLYAMEEKEARVFGIVDGRNWLDDFLDEIGNGSDEFTKSVFESIRKALQIQAFTEL